MDGSSKLSLYDFLTMFLSGSLWLMIALPEGILSTTGLCCRESSVLNYLSAIVFFIMAYSVGMLWHKFLEWSLNCIFKICHKSCVCKLNICSFFMEVFQSFERNSPELIQLAEKEVKNQSNNKDTSKQIGNDAVLRRYYSAYYYLQEKQALGSIPFLEAQEAFIRDIMLPLPLFFFFGISCNCSAAFKILSTFGISQNICCIISISVCVIAFLLLSILHRAIQKKIYESVWDSAYYISRLEEMRRFEMTMADPCICNLPTSEKSETETLQKSEALTDSGKDES